MRDNPLIALDTLPPGDIFLVGGGEMRRDVSEENEEVIGRCAAI